MIEVELFKDATFEYKIVSDNVNCPDLNVYTRLYGGLQEIDRMRLND